MSILNYQAVISISFPFKGHRIPYVPPWLWSPDGCGDFLLDCDSNCLCSLCTFISFIWLSMWKLRQLKKLLSTRSMKLFLCPSYFSFNTYGSFIRKFGLSLVVEKLNLAASSIWIFLVYLVDFTGIVFIEDTLVVQGLRQLIPSSL